MKQFGHVYIIDFRDGKVKVGHSCNPIQRRAALGLQDFDFAFISKAYEHVERIERAAHAKLIEHRERGETFVVPTDIAIEAVLSAERDVCGGEQPEIELPLRPDTVFPVRLDERHLDIVDELRRVEKDIPTRSEMIRRLIERAERKARK